MYGPNTNGKKYDSSDPNQSNHRPAPEESRCRVDASVQLPKYAYIALVTRDNYLAGIILLAYSLRKHGAKYPLIVLYPPSLSPAALHVLQLEVPRSNLILRECELLIPPNPGQLNVAVDRFEDTWTKLRVFEVYDLDLDQLCYLDADMLMFRNMDVVFGRTTYLPNDHIAAVHDCVCSPDKMPWTPHYHSKENCPFTPQTHEQALFTSVHIMKGTPKTYHLFNSGMFVFNPRKSTWDDILKFFMTTDKLKDFKFPDQDFLTHFYRHRFMPLSWVFNAVKTMAYRHQNIWDPDSIICMHYIVDKPWAKRTAADGTAGFKGKDGETHGWWWREYYKWVWFLISV